MAFNLKRKRGKDFTSSREKRRQTIVDADNGQDSELEVEQDDLNNSGSPNEGDDDKEDEGCEIVGCEDEQSEEDNEEVVSADDGGVASGKRTNKPPTGEELRTIKDATDLFRSNSFKLQIDALLPNVRPKSSRIPPLDRFLLSFHMFLLSLTPITPQHPLDAARSLLKKGIAVPYSLPLPTEDTNWKVSFEKPSDILVVGSWANKIGVKGRDGKRFGVDLAVEMPEGLFQEKDYLNGRYFHKKAFYLASIAAAIQHKKSGLDIDVVYESTFNDPRLTTLVLQPRKDDSSNDFTKLNAQIRIIPVLPSPSPIPLHRLSPSHSNIRISSQSSDVQTNLPTPYYNTSVLLSLTPKPDLLTAHALKQTVPAFGDALTLLRVWANQRGYGEGERMCVRGFEGKGAWWAAVIELLVGGEESVGGAKNTKERKVVGKGMSSYQIFRAVLDFLSKHDFEKNPVFVKATNEHQFQPDEYMSHHEAVFVNSSSTVNLLAGVPLGSLDMLKYDAKTTLDLLDKSSISQDPFTDVFLKDQRDLPARFDTIIRVDLASAKSRVPNIHSSLDYGSQANSLIAALATTIRRGLGNRTKAVVILHPTSGARPLSQAHPTHPSTIHIGLIHDSEHSSRLVDHGPPADDPDPSHAEQFREFWGDKAELRRFKDGRILESVVWDIKTSDERAHVPSMVIRYLLERHFGIVEDAVQTWQASFDTVLRLPENVARLYKVSTGSSSGFKGAITAFDQLVKALKALGDEMPLSLVAVSPVSEYLRYTSVFNPVPLPSASAASMPASLRFLPSMEVILEFEKSAKWPDDLRAIQKIKLAFFERIASALMNSMEGVKARVVVGDGPGHPDIQDQSRLEIVTAEGWAFSARIWHEREATLLDRIINNKPRFPLAPHKPEQGEGKERQEAIEARELYTRRFIHAPRHHRAIASLCHRFTAYAGTVRLVKRWLASHWLLHGHISEEVVELICAALFVGDSRALGSGLTSVPGTRERGFATVVEFLKDWKWEEGLFIPLYSYSDASGGSSNVSKKIVSVGSKHGVWMISTEEDQTGHIWTSNCPDIMAAHRVRAVAKATWDYLTGVETGTLDIKGLFAHPVDDYDFIIQLDLAVLPRYFQNITPDSAAWSPQRGKYANLAQAQKANEDGDVTPGFDPAQLLFNDLVRIYKDTLKFFYDPFGGDRIGAVWEPKLRQQSRPFRVLGGFSSTPNSAPKKDTKDKNNKKALVSLNEISILSEIERLASGMLKSIHVQS